MKKKIALTSMLLVLMVVIASLSAIVVSADESITVTYNWMDGSVWETAVPNADGSYTLRSNKKSGNATVTLSDGSVVDKQFFGWYTENGDFYLPGETVTLTKTTRLYEAYGVVANTAEDFVHVMSKGGCLYVKLGADMEISSTIGAEWNTNIIDLNGHNLVSTSNKHAISIKRGAIIILGKGKFTHAPATLSNDANAALIDLYSHGYGDWNNPQLCYIGKDVTIETPYSLLKSGGVLKGGTGYYKGMPNMVVAGNVTAKSLIRFGVSTEYATCIVYDTAVLNLSDSLFDVANQTGTASYMTVDLNGTINVADGNATALTDFILSMFDINIHGGKYCLSDADIQNVKYYLPDTFMLKEVTDGSLTWHEVLPSDCVHQFVLNEEETVKATLDSTGLDVFYCSLCQTRKAVVTVFDPSNTEITIIVLDENGERKEVTVKASDVFDISKTGVGENTQTSLVGIKGTDEYSVDKILAVEIPAGLSVISITDENNVLENINIVDGATVEIVNLAGLKAIKTINIGASTVVITSIGNNSSLEAIRSDVAGANVRFENNCCDGKTNIKVLTMTNGSTYSFGTNSFRKASIESIVFPDEATITFAGEATFYNATVKYAYFGNSITQIKNKPFDCANNLELVIIKNATFIDQYCFCVSNGNNATSKLTVYLHTSNVSINNNAFVNRTNHGVELYTIDPDIKSLNCTYTVYNGIPHKYIESVIKEPTCNETGILGFVVDCPCGVSEVVEYTAYTSSGSSTGSTEQSEIPLSTIHTMGTDIANIHYNNGYLELGTKELYCSVCKIATLLEENASALPIFVCRGYSKGGAGDVYGVTQKFLINKDALADYELYTGKKLEYGVFAAAGANTVSPLVINEGVVTASNDKVILSTFKGTEYDYFDIKIVNIDFANLGTSLAMNAYVFDGTNLYYLDNGITSNTAVSTTYNTAPVALVPSKEEE